MPVNQARAACALWVACVAILMAALAPAVSRVLTVARGAAVPSFEICTVAGGMNMLSLKASMQSPDEPQQPAMNMGDCLCCSMHVAMLELPPLQLLPATGALLAGLLPTLFYQSHTPLFAWTPLLARGPPAAF